MAYSPQAIRRSAARLLQPIARVSRVGHDLEDGYAHRRHSTRTVNPPTPGAVSALGVQQPRERGCNVSGRFAPEMILAARASGLRSVWVALCNLRSSTAQAFATGTRPIRGEPRISRTAPLCASHSTAHKPCRGYPLPAQSALLRKPAMTRTNPASATTPMARRDQTYWLDLIQPRNGFHPAEVRSA